MKSYHEKFKTGFSVNSPYCLQRLKNGKWIALNRDYKPLGREADEWVDYDNYPEATILDDLTPEIIEKLSCQPIRHDSDKVYLYCAHRQLLRSKRHMQAYLARLEIIASLKGVA